LKKALVHFIIIIIIIIIIFIIIVGGGAGVVVFVVDCILIGAIFRTFEQYSLHIQEICGE